MGEDRKSESDNTEQTRQEKPARTSQPKISTDPDFGPRYRVIGAIGKGGMGVVFRAYDTVLKGDVAIKVVLGDADDESATARFHREIALARKVTSPNVLRVYDLAEHQGVRFLSMEYVDGEDLAALMRREKKLPLDRALSIFRQVCVGLAAAHDQGVVHRDLKPQNVLVDRAGKVCVADFGLARSVGESGLTASGAILGSPAYMSPEQVKGDDVDERSDIYSLGVMLYQLVSGSTPFQGSTAHSVMEMRLHKPPKPLSEVAPSAPPQIGDIVTRCLAVQPDDRYQSIRDLLAELDAADLGIAIPRTPTPLPLPRLTPTSLPTPAPSTSTASLPSATMTTSPKRTGLLVGALAVALGGAGLTFALTRPKDAEKPVAAPTAPAVSTPAVVAPATKGPTEVLITAFKNEANDPIFDYTLSNLLEYTLRRSNLLNAIGPTRAARLAKELGPAPVGPEMGKTLAARYGTRVLLLEGAIATKGSGYRLSITVTDAVDGSQVFKQSADAAAMGNVVATATQLASALREKLGEKLSPEERERLAVSPMIEADHEFAVGNEMSDANDLGAARARLERALELDPSLTLARYVLAICLLNQGHGAAARKHFEVALSQVDRMGDRDRLNLLAYYHMYVTEDFERAIAAYEQVIAIWPHATGAQSNLAAAYYLHGDMKKALEANTVAMRDHPHDVSIRVNQPILEILNGQFETALVGIEKYIVEFPRPFPMAFFYKALASLLLGRRDVAIAALATYTEKSPVRGHMAQADLALAEGRLGDAATLLDETVKVAKDSVPEGVWVMRAELELRRGNKAAARVAAAKVTSEPLTLLEASLVHLAVGDFKRPAEIATQFREDVAPSHRAMARLIDAETARVRGKPAQAIIAVQEALRISDVALGHYILARAALDAKEYGEAYTALQAIEKRKAELACDISDNPSYRYVVPLTYYKARAQEGLGSSDAAATYKAFLALQHDPDPTDPLVADARKH